MNGRVCFLARAGDALAGARLVGLRTDESWRPKADETTSDAEPLRAEVREAANWIAERASGGIAYLCVDVDGSNCSWRTTPGADPRLVAAAIGQDEAGANWSSPGLDAASIQALAVKPLPPRTGLKRVPGLVHDGETHGQRLAVLAVPDTLARMVIDDLDDRAVSVNSAGSLWHAMAMSWDPASPLLATGSPTGTLDANLVGAAPVTGIVLVDPDGRLVWAWSRAGELLAGGVILTPVSADGAARVGRASIGRLVADWLGWSVQVGTAPARIVCIAGEHGEGTDEDMLPAQVGSAIGRAWPGTSVDMAVHDDPIGATLHRLAGSESPPSEDGRSSLLSLTRRPRRVHRSMYQWAALAVVLLAAALTGVGYKAWRNGSESRSMLAETKAQTRKLVLEAAPPQGDAVAIAKAEVRPAKYLEERIDTLERERSVPKGLPSARPILPELESLSYVLGIEGIELSEIRLSESLVDVHLYVPEVKVAEELKESLDHVANEHCTWQIRYQQQRKNNMQLIWLEGAWKDRGGGGS